MASLALAVGAGAVVGVVVGVVAVYWIAADWIAVAADPDWRGDLEDAVRPPAEAPSVSGVPTARAQRPSRRRRHGRLRPDLR